MQNAFDNFFGGPPLWVALRLLILSLVVGVILSVLGISPYDIIDGFRDLVIRIYNMGFEAIDLIWRYILIGAVIVLPIWLVLRLFALRKGGSG
ncbi:MAG: DUF6460 domain-containing protein [Pseudomonadota bacterium]